MSEERLTGDAALDAIAGLTDKVRRRLYEIVVASSEPVGRDEVAEESGLARGLVGYHLDRLAADGLLAVSFARRGGRQGPGAGRPAKLYAAAPIEVAVQVPPRDDAFLAGLLAEAVEAVEGDAGRVAVAAAARSAGERMGADWGRPGRTDLVRRLAERGYAPRTDPADDSILLGNCPFHHVAPAHLELICSANEALLAAATAGTEFDAVLDPAPGRCCVRLRHR
jgi:predicted ArsR family transcriptional regulator